MNCAFGDSLTHSLTWQQLAMIDEILYMQNPHPEQLLVAGIGGIAHAKGAHWSLDADIMLTQLLHALLQLCGSSEMVALHPHLFNLAWAAHVQRLLQVECFVRLLLLQQSTETMHCSQLLLVTQEDTAQRIDRLLELVPMLLHTAQIWRLRIDMNIDIDRDTGESLATIISFQAGTQSGSNVRAAQLHQAQQRRASLRLVDKQEERLVLCIAMGEEATGMGICSEATVAVQAMAIEDKHLAIGTCSHQQLSQPGGGQVTKVQLLQHVLAVHHEAAIDHAEENASGDRVDAAVAAGYETIATTESCRQHMSGLDRQTLSALQTQRGDLQFVNGQHELQRETERERERKRKSKLESGR